MISDSLKMKITAAVLSAIFSGSYISCAVIEAVNNMKKEMNDNENISATASDSRNISKNDPDNKLIELITTEITSEAKAEVTSAEKKKNNDESESTKKAVSTDETILTTVKSTTVQTSEDTKKVSETSTQASSVKETSASEAPVQSSEPVESKQQQNKPAPGGAVPESSRRDESYFKTCAFVGDSHVEGLKYIVPADRVLAKNGLNLSRIADTIPAGNVSALSPEHIYIMMGTNGVSWMNHSSMISDYTAYIKSLQSAVPSADIYVMSIPPVTSSKSVAENGIPNSSIVEYNGLVNRMCEENGWHFLDIHSAVADSSGCLTNDSTDGVHMPVGVYKNVIKDYLLSHVA